MLSNKERKEISKAFFDKAVSRGIINYISTFTKKTRLISRNIQSGAFAFIEFQKIYDDPDKLIIFCEQNKSQFGINEIHSKRLIKNYFVYHAFNYIEAYKLFFLEILKPDVKIGKRKITIRPKTELGTMIISICQELNFDDFEKLFPREFRNILGHSAWWWVDDSIAYEEKGVEQRITLHRLNELMKEFSDNMDELMSEYFRRQSRR